MKLGVYSICLPDLTPAQGIAAAAAAGYAGMEWRVGDLPAPGDAPGFFRGNRCTVPPDPAALAAVARETRAAGLTVIGLGVYIDHGDVGKAEAALRLAAGVNVPWIRLRAPWRDASSRYGAQFAAAVEFFSRVAELAERYGVMALIEQHQRTICPSASLTERLVSRFDPAYIGVIYDAGNLVLEGYEDHRMALDILGPYLAHVHVKNAAFDRPTGGGVWTPRWTPMDDGVLDVPALLTELDRAGYEGWISVEDFSTDRTPVDALRFNAEFLLGHGRKGTIS
ncbi:sugar phosphate isomerase/epimerase family protein [Nonomuraea sp. NPDC052129]|uniref:sugar phosphate isomerase/epimerase family protein n=1 Tax=Nonomuraea sp. NPDC052129 TaxID=3154651 RepID=UPI0034186F03